MVLIEVAAGLSYSVSTRAHFILAIHPQETERQTVVGALLLAILVSTWPVEAE